MNHQEWEAVIGLEVHVQLLTKTKIFSGASTQYGAAPNAQACVIDLAMPGVLPVLNQKAVELAILFGHAVNAHIAEQCQFSRKNYFYPDLPKGYQISQYDKPIVEHGFLDIEIQPEQTKRIRITRAHLEEDAGKSLHEDFHGYSGIDLNRAGVPLLEIVSEPDLRSAQEAVAYLKTLHNLVCYLGISDGNMQEGSFRCDANISVRPKGTTVLGTRAEIKNVNSFRFVERAIEYEIERQISLISSGGKVIQETRLYDADRNETRSMRNKEAANDYRYFPDPDLPPLYISEELTRRIKETLPELPWQKAERFQREFDLSTYDANFLSNSQNMAGFFEETLKLTSAQPKKVANWLMSDISALMNRDHFTIENAPIIPQSLAELLNRIEDGTISGKMAKEVLELMWDSRRSADEIIAEKGLSQIQDDSAIYSLIDEIFKKSQSQLTEYFAGKEKLFGYFVGQAMKESQGRMNPQRLNECLKNKLEEIKSQF